MPPTIRALTFSLLGLALFLRALVPAGWMPAGGSAFAIAPCPAAAPQPMVHDGGRHHGDAQHGQHNPAQHQSGHADCAFAPLQAGFAAADLPIVVPAPPLADEALPAAAPGSVLKTGPPALPPPATGPPTLA